MHALRHLYIQAVHALRHLYIQAAAIIKAVGMCSSMHISRSQRRENDWRNRAEETGLLFIVTYRTTTRETKKGRSRSVHEGFYAAGAGAAAELALSTIINFLAKHVAPQGDIWASSRYKDLLDRYFLPSIVVD